MLKEQMFDIMLGRDSILREKIIDNCRKVCDMQGGKISKKPLDEI